MGEGIPGLTSAYTVLFTAALIFLAILLVFCLIRAIIGPRVADRLVAVNMMGTIVMVIIAILTLMLQEGYLADICLIYAMISFLAVIVLTKVYMGVYLEKKEMACQASAKLAGTADGAEAESMVSDTAGEEKSNGNV
ncbi:MAG: sodium:proton antiporter [Clostridiales bacterium]|nr:sodium:proton antiporter [Clostridiales bacterium]